MNNRHLFLREGGDFAPVPATVAQRTEIRRLLRLAEYDTSTVGVMHRRLGVAEHEIGRPVEEWLDVLNKDQASVVIKKLRDQLE